VGRRVLVVGCEGIFGKQEERHWRTMPVCSRREDHSFMGSCYSEEAGRWE